jgi:hypothetical protein
MNVGKLNSLRFSKICCNVNIASVALLPLRKPHCSFSKIASLYVFSLFFSIFAYNLDAVDK